MGGKHTCGYSTARDSPTKGDYWVCGQNRSNHYDVQISPHGTTAPHGLNHSLSDMHDEVMSYLVTPMLDDASALRHLVSGMEYTANVDYFLGAAAKPDEG